VNITSTTATVIDLSDRDLRQRGLVPPEKLAMVHALVIGVGAIGRQVALQLAATGVQTMTLVDHDQVDVVNLAPKGYAPADLGNKKVHATAADCRRLNPELTIDAKPERFGRASTKQLMCFEGKADRRLAIFCCVDSIATRGIIWHATSSRCGCFVDARMSAEVIRVLASASPVNDVHYPSTLFESRQAHVGACTAKSTIYTASIAAGLMLTQFSRWLRGIPLDRDLTLNLLSSELTVS